jgi:predicted RNase H-like HicB family nuclease
MKYIVNIEECREPDTVRYWATVEGELMEGCHIAEETLEELLRNAPSIIKDVVELSNEDGANLPIPTAFEFRLLVNA